MENKMQFNSERFCADFSQGELFIHDDERSTGIFIAMHNEAGDNITLEHFRSCIASHGLDRACETFLRM